MSKVLPPRHPFRLMDNGRATVLETVRPSKITGTSLAGVVGKSPWDTPYTVACKALGLFREDIGGKPAVHTGVVLEPKILSHAGAIPAEEIFEKRDGDHDSWESDWRDDTFAGHVDGVFPDGRIVEVKTTNDLSRWEGGVPEHYWLQASLYSHFLADDSDITFLVGVVDSASYKDPYSWIPEGNVFRFDVPVHPQLDRILEYARFWNKEYLLKGTTPEPDLSNPIDSRVYNELKNMTMTEDELKTLLEEIERVQEEVDAYDSAIDDIRKDLEEKKNTLKNQMVMRNLRELKTAGVIAKVSEQTRESFDLPKARADGLAVEPYTTIKTSNTIRFKKI